VSAFRNLLAGAVVLGLCCAADPNRPLAVPKPPIQLGADVDLYAWAGLNYEQASAAEVAYLKKLHANAVTVSFPFFVRSRTSSAVYSTVRTPTLAGLAVFARLAMSNGLYVALRPLMDQGGIGESRANWAPRHPKAWFASYQKFLLPYAAMSCPRTTC
jgi:hypothetical protein